VIRFPATLLAVSLLLQGAPAAPPAPAAPASHVRIEDYRVARIGYRLGLAGSLHCPIPHPLTGLLLHHLGEYDKADRRTAILLYGLDRGPAILAVIEDSPAARAGLAAGDVLLAVNGQPLPAPLAIALDPAGPRARAAVEATERRLEDQLRRGPVRLSLLRSGRELAATLESLPGCPARVRLARSGQMNAFANRGYAIMTTALLGFMQSDDEIAIVLGHEIAHVILGHPERLDAQGVPRQGPLRTLGANGSRVRATEEEADRLGLRLAWAAGYDVSAAISFWRRYQGKISPRLLSTHPEPKARERLIEEMLAELASNPRSK